MVGQRTLMAQCTCSPPADHTFVVMGQQDTTKATPNAAIVAVHMNVMHRMLLNHKELRAFMQENKVQDRRMILRLVESMTF